MKRILFFAVSLLLFSGIESHAGSMSVRIYKKLQAIEILVGEKKLEHAESELNAMLEKLPQRLEDRAYIYYTAGIFYLQKPDYRMAKKHFESAYKIDVFPEKTTLYVLQTLAGLSMQEERFDHAIGYYKTYIERAAEKNHDVYLGLGTAYFYQKKYPDAVTILEIALKQFARKESLYRMLFSAYYEMKQLNQAAATLSRMIRIWPGKKKYWLQLASLYLEKEEYGKSLEILQAASSQDFLLKERDILQYAYTLYQEHLPYKAALVLQLAIEQSFLVKNRKNYELLSTFYQEAREREKAIEALKNAAVYSGDGKNDLCIAQLSFEMENAYEKVVRHAKKAIEKGIGQEGNANMLIAAAYTELGDIDAAKEYLVKASRFKETRDASARWLKSLE